MPIVYHGAQTKFIDPLNYVRRGLVKLYSLWVKMTYPFISIGEKVSVHFTTDIRNPHLIKLGSFINIYEDILIDPLGHAPSNIAKKGEPVIVIDDGCRIAHGCQISAKNFIHLGRNVILGGVVLIMDHNHAYEDPTIPIKEQGVTEGGSIKIGDGCWIGQGAAILCDKGELVLGENCVVGANAVVTRSCPAYSVLSGNPARIVRQFDPARGTWELGGSRIVETDAAKEARRFPNPVRS